MENLFLGIDIGSISVKAVLIDDKKNVVDHVYRRSYGKPLPVLAEILRELGEKYRSVNIVRCGATGTAGELVSGLIGGEFFNEIVAQSSAISHLCPEVRTVIEMGGADSKFMAMKPDENNGGSALEDFAMNSVCAAGTGSFLDQQAARMGYDIEGEFGEMTLKSKHPPRVAGRCSVFAKSDMIHLQQVGTPDYDIMAGLCHAVARSFKGSVARGKKFVKPVAFTGGVASNIGVVKAFEKELGLFDGELIIPEYHNVTGAIGAALNAVKSESGNKYIGHKPLEDYLNAPRMITGGHDALSENDNQHDNDVSIHDTEEATPVYIGIDIGSLSTNVVAIDEDMRVVARRYLRTAGRPIQAVTNGLKEIGDEIGSRVVVKGVGTTGSGRYMTGDFVGADCVRNEITAQATAAVHFVPDVDTIFEIGGQDSKYVSIKEGAVVDFEMNKVCAAGTGSFIEEQAERLNLDITKDFAESAFSADKPGKFGERCTVFIESDLVAHQQKGAPTGDLAAGLSYSIVNNYLNVVVGDRKIGDKILFQGGVAWNKAVVAAFAKVTGKQIHVPPHHDVTGAIGAAIIARRYMNNGMAGQPSRFKGFDLRERKYKVTTFECKACDNVCDVSRVKFEGDDAHYYGARCELFEKGKKKKKNKLPELFAEREKLQFGRYLDKKEPLRLNGRKVVGIPRVLTMHEHFPFWSTFFEELGCEVILSGKTNQEVIHTSQEYVTAETCFPIKILHGHVMDLIGRGIDYLFMPSVISMSSQDSKFRTSQNCPLVQANSYIVKTAMDLSRKKVELLEPPIHFQMGDQKVARELSAIAKRLGKSQGRVERSVKAARKAQNSFYANIRWSGMETVKNLAKGQKAVVIISRPYNGCDSGINMGLPQKLRDMGVIAIPIDMLPLDEKEVHKENPDMYWRSGQRMQAAAEVVRKNPNLNAIYISNFKCGPDSFINYHIQQQMRGKPYLHLEVDEHSADAGAITRCEAFFDSLENVDNTKYVDRAGTQYKRKKGEGRVLYLPYMCDHAYALSAALEYFGAKSEVLPKTDAKALEIGRKHSTGKECIPYTLTMGDIVKKAASPDFRADKSIFFMPATGGPCRFGQYNSALRMVLDKMGHHDAQIMTTDAEGSYSGFEDISPSFRGLAWRGIAGVDILQKLLQETRPYELAPGSTDSAYDESLAIVLKSLRDGGKDLARKFYDVRDIFRSVKIDRSQRRPIIGVVGEIYVRLHSFSNHDVVRQIEEIGGEAWVAPFGEWIFYCTDRFIANSKRDKKLKNIVSGKLFNAMLKKDEGKLLEPFRDDLLNWHEPSTQEVMALSAPYIEATFEGESILSVGKAIDYARKGCAGIVNLLPFSCMPGTVVSALSKKVRENQNNIPWLNIDIDGMNENNGRSRLEAFIFQTRQYEAQKLQKKEYNFV
ncbi:MAG: acyl-CoA dehydratase activase [Nitrospinota bacterium]